MARSSKSLERPEGVLCAACRPEGFCAWEAEGCPLPRMCAAPKLITPDRRLSDWSPPGISDASAAAQANAWLVTTHFNPSRFRRMRETYYEWRPTLAALRIQPYELVFDQADPELTGSTLLRGNRQRHGLWQKEAMLNRAFADRPPGTKYFGWFDHDLLFENPNWLAQAVAKLEAGATAVQLFSDICFLNREGRVFQHVTGTVAGWDYYGRQIGSPGGAWLARVDALEQIGGLYDLNVVGGGDAVFLSSLVDDKATYFNRCTEKLRTHAMEWVRQARPYMQVDYVPGTVWHLWHGDRENRQYVSRDKILCDFDYDPRIDVVKDEQGLVCWAGNKPELGRQVSQYFAGRREDG